MSINTINGSGYNQSFAITNHGSPIHFQRNAVDDFSPAPQTLGAEQARVNGYQGQWTLGTGVLVHVTGELLFTSATNGGALSSLVLANRGSTTLYYGLNDDNIIVGSGAPLQSGESIQLVDNIYSLWAITAAGETSLTANGIYNRNPNTV